MARMDIFRNTPKGIKPLAPTSINERVRRWRKSQEEEGIIIPAWHQRQKSGFVKNGRGGKLDDPSDPEESDDGDEEAPIPHIRPTPYFPPSPGTSAATTASTGFTQDQSLDAYPLLHEAESYLFSGADRNSGVPGGSYASYRLSGEGEEQMYEGICSNAPTFPEANSFTRAANAVALDDIYNPACSFNTETKNIYPSGDPLNPPMADILFQGYPQYITPQLDGQYISDNSWLQDLPTAYSQNTQSVDTTISTPVRFEDLASPMIPSPTQDPYMGADWDWSLAENLLEDLSQP